LSGPARGAALSLLAALAASLSAAPLSAQVPDTSFAELIIQLRIERGPEATLTALGRDSVVYLPLRRFLELAEVRVTDTLPGRRIAGMLEPGGVPFWFDTEAGTRGRTGQTGALTAGDAVWRDGELYVAAPLIGEVLEVVMRVDWGELSLTVVDAAALPVRRRLEREQRRDVLFAARRAAGPAVPVARLGEPLLDGAVLDYSLQVPSRAPGDNYSVSYGAGLAVLGGNFTYQGTLQRSPGGTFTSGRTSWTRAWPERRVVRQLRAGDTFLEGPRVRNVRGGAITNVPFLRPTAFGVDRFTGVLGPEWELELLSGGTLLSYAETDSAGRFVLPVPLSYGPNPLDVRAFGPGGQMRLTTRAFQVTFDRLPRGRFEYLAGGGECLDADPCSRLLLADARYGVSNRLTVRAGVEGFRVRQDGDAWHPYGGVAFALSPAIAATLDATWDGLVAGRATYSPHPDLRFEAGHTRFAAGRSIAMFGAGSDRRRTDAHAFWRPGGGRLQLVGAYRHAAGRLASTVVSGGPSLRLSSLTMTVLARRATGVLDEASFDASLNGLLSRWIPLLGRSLLTTSLQATCGATFTGCRPEPRQARVGLGRQLGASFRVDASANWQRDNATVFDMMLTAVLPYLRSVTRTGHADDFDYVSLQTFEGSVLWDRRGGRLRLDDGRSVGFAGIRGVVFMDANENGVLDPGEAGVGEALVRVGSRGVITDSLGRFAAFDLPPFERAVVEVDTLGLRDPTWIPAQAAVAVRPSPNGFRYVQVGLIQGQELTGEVTVDGRPLGQAEVRATHRESGRVLRLRTYEDGTFYLPSVRPGTYELALPRDLLERLRGFFAPVTVEVRGGTAASPVRLAITTR
jgi:hypothetical protein